MSRRQVGWGAAVAVVLGAVSGAVINELHHGWPWWVAAVVVTVVGALLAGRLASAPAADGRRVGPGAVVAGRDVAGRVRTSGSAAHGTAGASPSGIGPGAVVAGRDVTGTADIDTTGAGGPAPRGR